MKFKTLLTLFILLINCNYLLAQCDITFNQTNQVKNDNEACNNAPIHFFINAPDTYTNHKWTFSDNKVRTVQTPVHYLDSGKHVVYYEGYGPNGSCADTIELIINASPIIDVELLSPLEQCFTNNEFEILDKSKPGQGTFTELFFNVDESEVQSFKDTQPPIRIKRRYFNPKGGTYTIKMRHTNSLGCHSTKYASFKPKVYPLTSLEHKKEGEYLTCDSANITFLKSNSTNINDVEWFKWDWGDNTSIIGNQDSNSIWFLGQNNDGLIHKTFTSSRTSSTIFSIKLKSKDCIDTTKYNLLADNILLGKVFTDLNENCILDTNESSLGSLPGYIKINGGLANTSNMGTFYSYSNNPDSNTFEFVPFESERGLYKSICPKIVIPYDSALNCEIKNINLGISPISVCPILRVNVSRSRNRRCVKGETLIQYENRGFDMAKNVEIRLRMPKYINLLESSENYTRDNNGDYVFQIGNLTPKSRGEIRITDKIPCVNGISGLNQCIKVWISPPNSCIFPEQFKDSAKLLVKGKIIDTTNVRFVLKNTGKGNMNDSGIYRIYTSEGIGFKTKFNILKNDSLIIDIQRDSREFIAIDVVQYYGTKYETYLLAFIGNDDSFQFNPLRSTFPLNNSSKSIDEHCSIIRDSYDPNDKRAFPEELNWKIDIPNRRTIDYVIRFQNTGNDTAYKVRITDELTHYLDLNTLEMLSSSHDYQMEILSDRTLQFTFNKINLVDSATNPEKSQGYIRFKIAPRKDIWNGAIISNEANIYFDFNDPILTNSTRVYIKDKSILKKPLNVKENGKFKMEVRYIDTSSCFTYVAPSGKIYNQSYQFNDTTYSDSGHILLHRINLTINRVNTEVKKVGLKLESAENSAYFQWLNCVKNFEAIPEETYSTFTPYLLGTYALEVSKNGCKDTSKCIEVNEVTSINNIDNEDGFKAYPIPTNGNLNIDFKKVFKVLDLQVTDITGKLIAKQQFKNSDKVKVRLEGKPGVYFVKVRTENKKFYVFKVIMK